MPVEDSSTGTGPHGASAHDDGVARVETPTRRQLRLQQVDGRAVAPEPATDQRPDGLKAPLPGGRRDRRRRQSEARQAFAEDASGHLAGLQAAGTDDPFVVDPAVLAQQKALAARAAALNSRARRMQEPSERDGQRTPPPNDPTAAHNLSIITPPEFVRVPGSAQSVLRAPATSHIPVVLPRPGQPASVPRPQVQGSGSAGSPDPSTVTEPVGARDAFGLDPLDAMTAGLGRLRRVRYLQYSLLVVGVTALATGIIMTVSSLNG
ncbi:hypothetical protein [Arthrobacter sp. SX1312]|uniref:hypothetical protein n=1 Tax=Arthrobacter sp. SX1312 TaxID=2058896 RepID=UPI0011B07986|nr:hypothetical protein [Arthrobacter sp. SX1312]